MANLSSAVTFILYATTLLLILSVEPFYRDPLYDASLTIIKRLQAHATDTTINISKIISDLGLL